MKKAVGFVTLASVMLGVAAAAPAVSACGEKFLVPGRGTQFQRSPADRGSSAVLVYAPPVSELSKTLARLRVEASIRKVGYKPTIVTSVDGLDKVAAAGQRFDVILVDLADVPLFKNRGPVGIAPLVLPVALKLTAVQLTQARREFAVVLNAPSRDQDFLDAIDDGVASSRAAQARAAGKKR